jgi:hypothetical protein
MRPRAIPLAHVPHVTHPDEYVRAVVEFIKARQARRSLCVTLLASVAEGLSLPKTSSAEVVAYAVPSVSRVH